MLRWFRRTYPSYNLQPLLLKRYRELEEARAFNNWLGERRQAQEGQRHLDDVSRLTEAVHRQVPQLRYARADRQSGFLRLGASGPSPRPWPRRECGSLPQKSPSGECAAEAAGWGPRWTAQSRPSRSWPCGPAGPGAAAHSAPGSPPARSAGAG